MEEVEGDAAVLPARSVRPEVDGDEGDAAAGTSSSSAARRARGGGGEKEESGGTGQVSMGSRGQRRGGGLLDRQGSRWRGGRTRRHGGMAPMPLRHSEEGGEEERLTGGPHRQSFKHFQFSVFPFRAAA